jgi:hypothetical protein
LFVYLAREAPVGVVVRRGPSDWTRLSLWRTDHDAFEHGQWFRGRIYERRSDLSADGSLFIYFARRSAGPSPAGEVRDTWVAISRPPWFTALALWFVGGTYHVGGFFPDRRTIWFGGGSDPPDQGRLPPWLHVVSGTAHYVDRTTNWPERTIYLNRLQRDGWERMPEPGLERWQRRAPDGDQSLVKRWRAQDDVAAYGGPHVVEYAVRQGDAGTVVPLGRADWADFDQRGRLVVAQSGRLLHWQPTGIMTTIADLNAQRPKPAPSPAWATNWPRSPRS